jgi:hypothetical protein
VRGDVARLRRVAEAEDHLHRPAADPLGRVGIRDPVRARADALVPRCEHHVLGGAADVERERVADDRDHELGGGDVVRRVDGLRQLLLSVADDDEAPLLRVARAAADAAGVEDPRLDLGRDRRARVLAGLPPACDRQPGVHVQLGH